jgi:phasin family protein
MNMATTKSTTNGRAAKAANVFEEVTAASRESVRENFDKGMAAMSEMTAFGRENMEAWAASAAAAQRGAETISARAVAFTKSTLENHMAATKSLMTSKSVQEFVERQTEYAQTSFQAYVKELNSMSDLFAGVAKDALKPINERMTAVGHLIQTTTTAR